MQIIRGSKREVTLMEWNEQLKKAEKRLADSKKCYELYGDNKEWIEQDEKVVKKIKENIKEVIEYMDKHNIE